VRSGFVGKAFLANSGQRGIVGNGFLANSARGIATTVRSGFAGKALLANSGQRGIVGNGLLANWERGIVAMRYPIGMGGEAKTTKRERNRQAIRGLAKHAAALAGQRLAGQPLDVAILAKTLQKHVDAMDEADRLESARRDVVAQERRLEVVVRKALHDLRSLVTTLLGSSDAVLGDFGFAPHGKPGPKTAAVKAEAVRKSKETRTRRGTTGKRQRAKVKG
jgi:hypothetical protein